MERTGECQAEPCMKRGGDRREGEMCGNGAVHGMSRDCAARLCKKRGGRKCAAGPGTDCVVRGGAHSKEKRNVQQQGANR